MLGWLDFVYMQMAPQILILLKLQSLSVALGKNDFPENSRNDEIR